MPVTHGVTGSSPVRTAKSLGYGVIGNTSDFGSDFSGSSPDVPTLLALSRIVTSNHGSGVILTVPGLLN